MKCPHCGDQISDTTCTAFAVRANAELRKRIQLARKQLGAVSLAKELDLNWHRSFEVLADALDLRKPLPKARR